MLHQKHNNNKTNRNFINFPAICKFCINNKCSNGRVPYAAIVILYSECNIKIQWFYLKHLSKRKATFDRIVFFKGIMSTSLKNNTSSCSFYVTSNISFTRWNRRYAIKWNGSKHYRSLINQLIPVRPGIERTKSEILHLSARFNDIQPAFPSLLH